MSETPKAKTTAKKPATKKAVIADSTNADKPVKAVKKAPAKKKAPTVKQVLDAVDEVIAVAEANKSTVKKVVKAVAPKVTDAEVQAVLDNAPSFWAKVKALFTGK